MSGLIQDPQGPVEQPQMVIHNPGEHEVIPKGTASLVDRIKATVRSIYPEKGDYLFPLMNAKVEHMKQLIC